MTSGHASVSPVLSQRIIIDVARHDELHFNTLHAARKHSFDHFRPENCFWKKDCKAANDVDIRRVDLPLSRTHHHHPYDGPFHIDSSSRHILHICHRMQSKTSVESGPHSFFSSEFKLDFFLSINLFKVFLFAASRGLAFNSFRSIQIQRIHTHL